VRVAAGIGRVQPPDGLAQAPHQHHFPKRIPLRRRFTGRELRPVPDRIAQLPDLSAAAWAKAGPLERGIFDHRFGEGHDKLRDC